MLILPSNHSPYVVPLPAARMWKGADVVAGDYRVRNISGLWVFNGGRSIIYPNLADMRRGLNVNMSQMSAGPSRNGSQGLLFDGATGNYGEVETVIGVGAGTAFDINSTSVSVLFQSNDSTVVNRMILSRHSATSSRGGFSIIQSSDGVKGDCKNNSGTSATSVGPVAPLGRAQMITLSFGQNKGTELYQDGKLTATNATNISSWGWGSNLMRIGRSLDAFWGFPKGVVLAIFWHTKPLTLDEVETFHARPFAGVDEDEVYRSYWFGPIAAAGGIGQTQTIVVV